MNLLYEYIPDLHISLLDFSYSFSDWPLCNIQVFPPNICGPIVDCYCFQDLSEFVYLLNFSVINIYYGP
jgi:hypothetical protein